MKQTKTILVVDDCAEDVAILQRAFLKGGFDVAINAVSDGEEAVQYFSGKGAFSNRDTFPLPSLVLLDLKMPNMDGFEVLGWLATKVETRVPVAVFSSSNLERDVDRAYKLGASSFLTKPSSFREYATLVETLHQYWLRTNHPPTWAA